MFGHRLMTAEEEYALATEILEHRVALWRSIMGYLPHVDALAAVLEGLTWKGEQGLGVDELATVRRTSLALRRRETRANKDAHDGALDRVAAMLSEADVADAHLRTMTSEVLELGRRGRADILRPRRPPPRGSGRYAGYIEHVTQTSARLDAAKQKFVAHNMRLAKTVADRYVDTGSGLTHEDLVQEGAIGLIKAVDRFDPRKGFRFSTYALWWLRHAIGRAVANKQRTIRLPQHIVTDLIKVRRAMGQAGGRPLTAEEIAEATGLKGRRVETVLSAPVESPVPLDVRGPRDLPSVVETKADARDSVLDLLEVEAEDEAVQRALDALKPRARDIVERRFGLGGREPETLKQVGESYGLSRERIRQLEQDALAQMRRALLAAAGDHFGQGVLPCR